MQQFERPKVGGGGGVVEVWASRDDDRMRLWAFISFLPTKLILCVSDAFWIHRGET